MKRTNDKMKWFYFLKRAQLLLEGIYDNLLIIFNSLVFP